MKAQQAAAEKARNDGRDRDAEEIYEQVRGTKEHLENILRARDRARDEMDANQRTDNENVSEE